MRLLNQFISGDEKAIAYDILISIPACHTDRGREFGVEFRSWEDRIKSIKWLSEAISPFLDMKKYKNLSWAQKNEFAIKLCQNFVDVNKLDGPPILPIYAIPDCRTDWIYYIIECDKIEDGPAIKKLKEFISAVLEKNYPELCASEKTVPLLSGFFETREQHQRVFGIKATVEENTEENNLGL